MEKSNRAKIIIKKYLHGNASDEERAILESWHLEDMAEIIFQPTAEKIVSVHQQMREKIVAHIGSDKAYYKPRHLWPWIATAASIILCLSICGYFGFHKKQVPQLAYVSDQGILPGSNKAILTLANGRRVILTVVKNGALASQGNAIINKTADGKIAYEALPSVDDKILYNTMATPRGGQYRLTLADGTQVWLNAASSIKYPTAFNGQDRQVEITGEVYFEVAHNAHKPFRVISNGQAVEVLGTHFNINAYMDEKTVKTTLLEGKVKVTAGNHQSLLIPGQQSLLDATGLTINSDADLEESTAWRNGYFIFNHEHIESIMRKVSRWYDVDIVYEGTVSKDSFGGTISRYANAGEVLKKLELTGQIHFKIEGRRITVLP